MNIVSFLFGILIELFWLLFSVKNMSSDNGEYFGPRFLLEILSFLNAIFFFTKSRTVQLFYTDSSALKKSRHAKVRTISSKRRKTLRYIIGKFLRGTAEQREERPWTLGSVIELDVWVIVDFSKYIFIFLNPLAVYFSHCVASPAYFIQATIVTNAFFFFFMIHVESSIADQKLIGDELYKTQTIQTKDRNLKAAPESYAERIVLRRVNYGKNGVPRYGPGTDLRPYYKTIFETDDDLDEDPSERMERSPVFRQK